MQCFWEGGVWQGHGSLALHNLVSDSAPLRVRSATTVICGIIIALEISGCLEYHMVRRVRQLILIWTKKKKGGLFMRFLWPMGFLS